MAQFILLDMIPLKLGSKVKANEIVASTKNFKDGVYSSGANKFICVMNYLGHGHEDAYCISEDMANDMSRDIIKELSIIIPPDTKVIHLEKEINKKITENDTLVEFVYPKSLDDYMNMSTAGILSDEEEEANEAIFSKNNDKIVLNGIEGEIIDIRVYINNKNSIDRQVVIFHSELVKEIKNIIKKLEFGKTREDEKQKSRDNLDLNFIHTGNHKYKNIDFLGARIVYRIRQKKSLSIGDKLAARYGTKGVISKIIPKDELPYTKLIPKIDVFLPAISILGRKNIATLKELYLGKVIYFLNEKVKNLIIKNEKQEKIFSLIEDVYKLISPSDKVFEDIMKKIKSIKTKTLFEKIINNEFTFRMFYPPFTSSSFSNIKEAAEVLSIELDEYVYLPSLGQWTKTKVPVGVSYYNAQF